MEIEAVKFTGSNWGEIETFVPVGRYNDDGTFQIVTLEGEHKCSIGDYVIKGVKGEFYPCKPDIFEATYDEVPDENRWDDAINNAKFMLEEYKNIPAGAFGAINIANAIGRYENGERTEELLNELESIQ
ncbi:hypothetical protein J19TS2_30970 [Cohnella xylanilytica]|uniref:hypothetical protein n=1 Tax=Cohnella xylanilytica TaxID=557555 RepID=UPI001B0E1A48|nr:hypothetical protein [Cohnella xylanilytica]GIO13542.1 hypothetical protein J19TS2_30970 [Cohnella xylanilytica]